MTPPVPPVTMRSAPRHWAAALTAAIAAAVAGSHASHAAAHVPERLPGVTWVVDSVNAAGVIDNSRLTLVFSANGRVTGLASCNGHAGRYHARGSRLQAASRTVTQRVCAPALMQQERRFLAALAAARRIRFTDDGALVMMRSAGREVLHARHD